MNSRLASTQARTARHLTETAACACMPWIGQRDKHAADAAAVQSLRRAWAKMPLGGRVVIGEGEKDDAPALAPGEHVGAADAPPMDVAVDPLEGTRLAADAAPGALSVLALAPAGSIQPLGRAFYMHKLIGPADAADALNLDAPPPQVACDIASAIGVAPVALRVAVQDRPRHEELVRALRNVGAQVHLFADGDLSFALQALHPRDEASGESHASSVDVLWGVGGAPEGLLAAAAQRATGGAMQMRLAPRSARERRQIETSDAGPAALHRTYTAPDLVRAQAVTVALTGVTDGPLLRGVQHNRREGTLTTETLLLQSGTAPKQVCTEHAHPERASTA